MNKLITSTDLFYQTKTKQRSAGLDIVRTIACLSVIASHFFLYTDFNTTEFTGISMFVQGMLASIVVGSDLYMILTGFLCCNKTIGKQFYEAGIKVILSYIFFSLVTILVNVYIFHTGMTWKSGLLGILSFSTIPYAWYIEMWIGLFLLAPFINIWYKALHTKKLKLYLIAILFALSIFPDFFNRYGLYVVPQYWENIYPLAFYFTGAFIREYKPALPRRQLMTLGLCVLLISPCVTLMFGYPTFLHIIGDRNGAFIAALSIAIFLTFYNYDVKTDGVRMIFKSISLRSLDIFLCSAVFDFYIYPLFKNRFFIDQSQFGLFYFIIIPLIFTLCYSVASVKRLLFSIVGKALGKLNISIALQSRG